MAKITFAVEIDGLKNDQLDVAQDALISVLNKNRVFGQIADVPDEIDRKEDDDDE